jgi:hypothetical protein
MRLGHGGRSQTNRHVPLDHESAELSSGESGESGDNGESGESGESGDNGESGESGDNGESGESGDNGESGESSNGESRLLGLSALKSRRAAIVVGTDDGVVTSLIDVRSLRLIGSGSPDPSSDPARARPLNPKADAVASAATTFQSLGRLP